MIKQPKVQISTLENGEPKIVTEEQRKATEGIIVISQLIKIHSNNIVIQIEKLMNY